MTEEDATVMASSSVVRSELGGKPGEAGTGFPPGLSAQELSHLLKGEVLDHFHLLEYIGGGGMGVVFRAQDTTLNRVVAVKVVASRNVSTEDLKRRFLVEAQSAARLDHPNIARVHYVGRDRNLPYIVFEYIDGGNIRDLVAARGPMPGERAVGFAFQIADALAHAWERDVVHRDIKPSNIVVTSTGQAKLVDMGLARFAEIENPGDLTTTGVTLGTFDYISPEQARDPRLADTRSDIYSLGCTVYYMLTGDPPFPDGTATQKLLRHQEEPPPDLAEARPDVPASLLVVLGRMLAKNPDLRQQTPEELLAELAEVAQELGVEATPFAPPRGPVVHSPVPWLKRNASWVVPLGVIALLGSLLAWYDSSRPAPQQHAPLVLPGADEADSR